MRGLEGKLVAVVGGASGMGRATAVRLIEEGARVAILDRDGDTAKAVAASLGDRASATEVDITDEASVSGAFQTIAGSDVLHAAINTAGVGFSAPIANQDIADFRRVYEVNVFGLYNLIRAESAILGPGGSIVNFASTNARQVGENISAYASSKAAVVSLTEVAALELAPRGIRVVGVGPALTDTPMVRRFLENSSVREGFLSNIPLGRPADPAEIAALATFLVSADADYLTGQTFYADGGSLLLRYPNARERTPA